MVSIGSLLMISYLTSIVSNTVSPTVFKIFGVPVLWPSSTTVQGHPSSKVTVPIDSPGVVSWSASTDLIMVSVTVFEIFDIKLFLTTFVHRTQAYKWAKVEENWHARAQITSGCATERNCSCSWQSESTYQIWLKSDDKWERYRGFEPKSELNWK